MRDLGDQLEFRLRRKKLQWALSGADVQSALDIASQTPWRAELGKENTI